MCCTLYSLTLIIYVYSMQSHHYQINTTIYYRIKGINTNVANSVIYMPKVFLSILCIMISIYYYNIAKYVIMLQVQFLYAGR